MTKKLEQEKAAFLLSECVSSVFADMAFIDVQEIFDPPPKEEKSSNEKCVAIDVLAPISCRIELRINQVLRDRIVENLFGYSSDAEQKKNGEDAILEMLNIIAGSFLSAYFGTGMEIQLELPQYLYFDDESPGQTVARIFARAEGEPLSVTLNSIRYRY